MIEEIRKHKPEGATHWRCGTYFKKVNPVEWYYWEDNQWIFSIKACDLYMSMTTL